MHNQIKNHPHIYSGDIVAGSLLIPESRTIASLLKKNISSEQWRQAIEVDNVLQKRSPLTAKRQARLIKNRLSLMPEGFLDLVENSSHEVTTQALLAAAIKHSRLLGDFLDQIVQDHWRTFQKQLTSRDWDHFLDLCVQKDPHIKNWSESTLNKLRQVIIRILAEASYIDGTKTQNLLPVTIVAEVRQFLTRNGEDYILHCMEATG